MEQMSSELKELVLDQLNSIVPGVLGSFCTTKSDAMCLGTHNTIHSLIHAVYNVTSRLFQNGTLYI